jgi:hypothetical protein
MKRKALCCEALRVVVGNNDAPWLFFLVTRTAWSSEENVLKSPRLASSLDEEPKLQVNIVDLWFILN